MTVPGEAVLEAGDGGHDRGVDVGRQGAGQGLGLAGDVSGVIQPSGWCFGPAPRGDVVEEGSGGDDGVGRCAGRHGPAGGLLVAAPRAGGGPLQERFDVMAFQCGEGDHVGVAVAEELAQAGQVVGDPGQGAGTHDGAAGVEVGGHDPADLGRADTVEVAGRTLAGATGAVGSIDDAGLEQDLAEPADVPEIADPAGRGDHR